LQRLLLLELKPARLRSPTAQRPSRRWSDFRCAALWSAVVWRTGRNHERNRIREVL